MYIFEFIAIRVIYSFTGYQSLINLNLRFSYGRGLLLGFGVAMSSASSRQDGTAAGATSDNEPAGVNAHSQGAWMYGIMKRC